MLTAKELEDKGRQALAWVDERFPLSVLYKTHVSEYYAPKNFNFWYLFGSMALLVLVIQIVTGIFLVMHYKPDASLNAAGVPVAFASVEYIMREVPGGRFIRYMHSTGASMFFIVVYLHMFRGLLYGSYRKPRELVWLFGMAIFLCLMGEAFFGYLLPWGQMSGWGAQVIVNLFAAIPVIGPDLSVFIRGDFVVSDATLNRFFAFHVIAIPLVLLGLVTAHLIALHEVGSNNPDGVEIKERKDEQGIPLDGIPFHPYHVVKDVLGAVVLLIVFSIIVFFMPEGGGYFLEYNNFMPYDQLKTPPHIAPVWYFTPYYSMLRATTSSFLPFLWLLVALIVGLTWRGCSCVWIRRACLLVVAGAYWGFFGLTLFGFTKPPFDLAIAGIHLGLGLDAKFWGVVMMGGSVMLFALLPWLDRSPVRSIRYKGVLYKAILAVFVICFLILGYYGTQPPSPVGNVVSQICTILYLAYFGLMPWYSKLDKCKPVPERLTWK
ncbi:MAG: cytochrome b [Candidatus Dactylopiibacterium carminicum]|uniref:Cytochrome b n=1 Tax=Candidatus Dactylopiibacterium carminicum TaxID=857335 RepID=A0A272ENP6_9RHOO|nr:cytochrome bc complex cytochrome b subunit [Candidatus Dactylopiibacterium carminicum]KAF7598099.1 cytochrome b [Candidatus Dactylopiibacterium carminicum]PAS91731.1 MAG: cytochrome b [Candidatus Dactylopiibacterium carminicum]PAS93871.1 MAG: cytochrome b [Candidatus Dactylopiibacterium carminicum]PAS96617.1 MAG: cytochrome b [Candidatus Dactylopiibacterium carminicum]